MIKKLFIFYLIRLRPVYWRVWHKCIVCYYSALYHNYFYYSIVLSLNFRPLTLQTEPLYPPMHIYIYMYWFIHYAQFIKPNGTITVKLLKGLYGTVEAAKLWYDLITKILCDDGFSPNPYDKCVLNKPCTAGKALTVVLYVDDLPILGPYNEIQWLKGYLESKFPEVSYHEGEVLDYIGMTLDFQKLPGKACITMKQITDDIIDTSGVTITHPTPADANLFDVNESSPRLSPPLEAYFRTYVAKGLYLAKRVRPEILVAIAFLATRAAVCTDEDMVKLVRVIGYLRREPDRGIVIDVGDDPAVGAFIDAAYGVHKGDGKSHTGASLVYGIAGPVYVTSVKQSIVTKSSTESELVAFSDVA